MAFNLVLANFCFSLLYLFIILFFNRQWLLIFMYSYRNYILESAHNRTFFFFFLVPLSIRDSPLHSVKLFIISREKFLAKKKKRCSSYLLEEALSLSFPLAAYSTTNKVMSSFSLGEKKENCIQCYGYSRGEKKIFHEINILYSIQRNGKRQLGPAIWVLQIISDLTLNVALSYSSRLSIFSCFFTISNFRESGVHCHGSLIGSHLTWQLLLQNEQSPKSLFVPTSFRFIVK